VVGNAAIVGQQIVVVSNEVYMATPNLYL